MEKKFYKNKDSSVAEAAKVHNEQVADEPTLQGSTSQDKPLMSVSTNETLDNKVITDSINALKTSPIDTPKLSMGISANVANLYSVDGYSGQTFIGDSCNIDEDDYSSDSNLLSIRMFEDMQRIDMLPDKKTVEDVFKNATDFRETVMVRPVMCVQPLEFNMFGIANFKKDKTLVKKMLVFRLIDLIARGQAAQLTDSTIFKYDNINCYVGGSTVAASIPAFVQMYYMNMKLGLTLQNLLMTMNNVKQMLISRSQDSMKRKLECDRRLAAWERSSNKAIRYDLVKQTNAFNMPGSFWDSIKEGFLSLYKERTGLISPMYMTNFIMNPEIGDEAMDDITMAGQTIITGSTWSDMIKRINGITWKLIAYSTFINTKHFNKEYADWLPTDFQTNQSLIDINNDFKALSNELIAYKAKMDAYDKIMNVFISAGFASDQTAVREDESYPSTNKPIVKLMSQLSYARANSIDVGLNVTILLDIINVHKIMTHKFLSAFFMETAPDNINEVARNAVVKPPKMILAVCSWYGSYYMDLTKAVPHLTIDGSTNGDSSGNDNIQLSATCTTSNVFLDVVPMYTYPLSGTSGNGVVKSPFYYGVTSVITGSLNEGLMNYMLDNILGGRN